MASIQSNNICLHELLISMYISNNFLFAISTKREKMPFGVKQQIEVSITKWIIVAGH